ncbi:MULTISPECIES: Gfo/Idh/MocA family protein [Paenibacillus]|uniref:Gfo/Idh/MocA family protein n=1 Tax=Paenibacillus TaxID=44249 RepID=UPI000178943B|nr:MULTISPECIES: Gfo/Idh/MocA family oxidoreductase [Paenibacillus]ACX63499.1 Oxidoreductase domain protein [Paenibacillus sp. Y412MC10]MCM3260501.1 Gfo/Idh/MocA family oxidoreductase [Paenibacillus lautus]
MTGNARKFGIIGCQHAHIGMFIEEMLALGYECAGVYEPDNQTLARTLADRYGLELTGDRESMLADEGVGIIGCAAINDEKMDVMELCELHGKPVMIDKPAVTDRAGLIRLRGLLDRGRIEVGMMLTERFRPSIHTVHGMIRAGELGDIIHISMRKPHRLNPETRPAWHFDRAQSGGIINDLFVHDFDLLRWLTGREVETSSGYLAKHILPEYPTFYDAAGVQVFMAGGITAQLYADWHTPAGSWTWGDGRIFITGTRGIAEIRLEGDPLLSNDEVALVITDQELRSLPLTAPAFSLSQDFLNRVAGEAGLITHDDIYKASEATVMADEGARILIRE